MPETQNPQQEYEAAMQELERLREEARPLQEMSPGQRSLAGLEQKKRDIEAKIWPLQDRMAYLKQRAYLYGELEQSRGRSALLQGRSKEVFSAGRRDLLEDEQRRLQMARTAMGAAGHTGSGLEQRVMRAEREQTSENITKLKSAVTVQEMTEAYNAEQAAIQRLYENGETDLAFQRQVVLTSMQIQAAYRIAEMQQSGNIMASLFSSIGRIATIPVMWGFGAFEA